MEILAMLIALPSSHRVLIQIFSQDIAVFLTPGGVVDLCHDRLYFLVTVVITVIKTDGIETITEISQVGEQSNRPGRSTAQSLLDQVTDRLIHRDLRVAQVVLTAEISEVNFLAGPKTLPGKKVGEFGQVEKHQEQPVPKTILDRMETAVTHMAFVNAAMLDHKLFPKC
jgi:hypothetical protein